MVLNRNRKTANFIGWRLIKRNRLSCHSCCGSVVSVACRVRCHGRCWPLLPVWWRAALYGSTVQLRWLSYGALGTARGWSCSWDVLGITRGGPSRWGDCYKVHWGRPDVNEPAGVTVLWCVRDHQELTVELDWSSCVGPERPRMDHPPVETILWCAWDNHWWTTRVISTYLSVASVTAHNEDLTGCIARQDPGRPWISNCSFTTYCLVFTWSFLREFQELIYLSVYGWD